MCYQVPGLLVLGEVGRQREVAVEDDAPPGEQRQLQAERRVPGAPDAGQRIAAPAAGEVAGVRRRYDLFVHERNLTARIGE